MWELEYKESWAPKNWCFWTMMLEETLERPLDCKEIQPVHPKGNQSWIFIGRTDAEAETAILWQPDVKNWLIWKDTDPGKDWRWEEKGPTEDEMAGWHHWPMDMSLSKSGSWWRTGKPGLLQSVKWQSDMTEQLNWTELKIWFTIQIGKYVTKGLFLPSSSILHCTVTHRLCNAGHVRTLPVDT